MRVPRLPYFDTLLALLERGEPAVSQAFGRHVHWGYWPDPERADGSPTDLGHAAEALSRLIWQMAEIEAGMRILDAGCGFGGTMASINDHRQGVELVGVNIDARQLARARHLHRAGGTNRLHWVQADACRLPFADACFDVILAVECIFHFPSRTAFFKEAQRLLKPGGWLLISDFLPIAPLVPAFDAVGFWSRHFAFYGGCRLHWTLAHYQRAARRFGLDLPIARNINRETLPTYTALRRLASHVPELAWRARVETGFAAWASRRGWLEYWVLGFAKTRAAGRGR